MDYQLVTSSSCVIGNSERKRVKIQYDVPDKFKKCTFEANFKNLASYAIPEVKHHRATYLHYIMLTIEEILIKNSYQFFPSCTIESFKVDLNEIKLIHEKLSKYIIAKRRNLSYKHRTIIWAIRLRLNLILYLCNLTANAEPSYGFPLDLKYLIDMNLISYDKPISAYSLSELWRALTILISKINNLIFHETLKYYIDCLELCCGKFLFLIGREENVNLFKHHLFTKMMKNGTICVNEDFIIETERIFYGLKGRLYIYSQFRQLNNVQIVPHSDDKKKIMYKWLSDFCKQTAFLEFIEKSLKQEIYEWDLYIGERERYMEEVKFADPTAYNIIAKWRPDQIDIYVELLNKKGSVVSILKRMVPSILDKKTNQEKYVDITCDGLCTIIIDYVFDAILSPNGGRFSNRFIRTRDQFITEGSEFPIHSLSTDFPWIVQMFNEYGIYYQQKFIYCSDFATCFIEWVRVACEETGFYSMLPKEPKSNNLLFIYEKLFPENVNHIQFIKKKLDLISSAEYFGIRLPSNYTDDNSMVF